MIVIRQNVYYTLHSEYIDKFFHEDNKSNVYLSKLSHLTKKVCL